MDTSEKFSDSKQVIQFLTETFPACFTSEGDAKPLKIGIFQDLAEALKDEPRVSKTLLRSSLRHYTNSWRYLYSIKEGADRVSLDGSADAKVEKDHEDHAQLQLKESKQKVAERKKSEAKARQQDGEKKNYKNKSKANGKTAPDNAKLKERKAPANRPKPEKLTDSDLVAGTKVSVKVGKSPMPATIVEVGKDGIQVILDSGMQIKVQQDNLRLIAKKR
ncbi:RNA chaperone ProQ [Planctobacterium marinum]|uniref:RNA chaperone ProQ n=1 Tax=Planctobacterium marinum TaxID=1631968 RepID=UPI001E3FBBBE|nr:RNA chaperone ProQ [Planctobacterium marinum]MCC2604374.1 RNA chaperone ProQ [Planctobacterium marinum]